MSDEKQATQDTAATRPPAMRAMQAAGPIVLDIAVLGAALLGARWQLIDADLFKYILVALATGNIALRLPGKLGMPTGGGLVMALASLAHRGTS